MGVRLTNIESRFVATVEQGHRAACHALSSKSSPPCWKLSLTDELYNFAEDASDNPTFYADLTNPQSLNKYQYTYNNPLNLVDPDGHCPTGACG